MSIWLFQNDWSTCHLRDAGGPCFPFPFRPPTYTSAGADPRSRCLHLHDTPANTQHHSDIDICDTIESAALKLLPDVCLVHVVTRIRLKLQHQRAWDRHPQWPSRSSNLAPSCNYSGTEINLDTCTGLQLYSRPCLGQPQPQPQSQPQPRPSGDRTTTRTSSSELQGHLPTQSAVAHERLSRSVPTKARYRLELVIQEKIGAGRPFVSAEARHRLGANCPSLTNLAAPSDKAECCPGGLAALRRAFDRRRCS